jgi:hypothetical protein
MNGFEGLNDDEFRDVHLAVEEAFAYVAVPVVFREVAPSSINPMYGEGKGTPQVYARLYASYNPRPSDEILTQFGLYSGVNTLLVIPRQEILLWERGEHELDPSDTPRTFALDEGRHFFEVEGDTYDVVQFSSPELPVSGGGTDWITLAVTGKIKPGPAKR